MTITIYGASDDLVEVAGCPNADEFNSDDWHGDLCHATGTMRVYARYEDTGCWPVTITQAPAMNPGNPGYSALLTVGAPEGTYLTGLDEDDE